MRWLVAAAVVASVATACGGGGRDHAATRVRTSAEPVAVRRVSSASTSTTTAAPAAVPAPASTTTTSTTLAPPLPAPPAPPPVVTVSVATVQGGSVSRSDGSACSNISSQTLAKGRLEVQRTGSTAAPLTVRYTTTGGAGDFTPLPDAVTIPAGSASATVEITPTIDIGPAPQHVHRSTSVAFTVLDDPAYDLAGPSTAAVTLTFDVDVFGCDPPTT